MRIDLLQSEDSTVVCCDNRLAGDVLYVGLIGVRYGLIDSRIKLYTPQKEKHFYVILPPSYLNLTAWGFAPNVVLRINNHLQEIEHQYE